MAIVTISRGSMSGGEELARCLGARLHYPVLAREVLVEAAATLGISEDILREKIQMASGAVETLREDRRIYLLALQSALADRSVTGKLIYHGNAGHFLLKGLPGVLRVRLIAPRQTRIRELVKRQGLAPDAAREYLDFVDRERAQWTKFVYGVDWRDPKNYDLVIHLRDVTIEAACAMVSAVIALPAYAVTENVKKGLRSFAFLCRIQLALARDSELRCFEFEVRAENGQVDIVWQLPRLGPGSPLRRPEEARIRQAAMTVEGVKKVAIHLAGGQESGRAA